MKVRTHLKAGSSSAEELIGCDQDYNTGYEWGYKTGFSEGCKAGTAGLC